MAVLLDGGCRVATMNEGTPHVDGSLTIRTPIGPHSGAKAISLRMLEFGSGESPVLRNEQSDEVLYSLDDCTVFIDDLRHTVEAQTGIHLRMGQSFRVANNGPDMVRFVSAQCPAAIPPPQTAVVRLADRRAVPTADRWYRVLVESEVTQFVGSIPPGRAPDHFHEYEEVLFILRGEGKMWAGESNTPIGPGSCIYLPPRQVHCVENTGAGELRVLGVFYPAGSPAVRYEPTQNP